MNWKVTEEPKWRHWVTPKSAKEQAVHRWYLFPHSFTGDLVHALIQEWGLNSQDRILDPFVGSGTTLLAAKEMDVSCDGYDLSPLAVLASNTKTITFSPQRLQIAWHKLQPTLAQDRNNPMSRAYPALVQRALPEGRLEALDTIARAIDDSGLSSEERDFFRLALISIIPRFSHAVANGGWLRWLNQGASAENVVVFFRERVELMLSDVWQRVRHREGQWGARVADARILPAPDATYSAVITSRHIRIVMTIHGFLASN